MSARVSVFCSGPTLPNTSSVRGCTDPKNFELVGIPPADLLMEVVAAWTRAGLDAVEILRKSTELTREFVYDTAPEDIRDRIKPRFVNTKLVPVKNRTLGEVLHIR